MKGRTPIHPGDGDPRHGTVNGYNNLHCRCDECAEAKAAYQAGGDRQGDRLLVSCWCEASVVWVPAADVRRGVTGSCRARCTRVSVGIAS